MAYYVSAMQGGAKALALGPFRTHGAALASMPAVKRFAERRVSDVDHFDTEWGTAHHKVSHRPGKLNSAYGVRIDADGFVVS